MALRSRKQTVYVKHLKTIRWPITRTEIFNREYAHAGSLWRYCHQRCNARLRGKIYHLLHCMQELSVTKPLLVMKVRARYHYYLVSSTKIVWGLQLLAKSPWVKAWIMAISIIKSIANEHASPFISERTRYGPRLSGTCIWAGCRMSVMDRWTPEPGQLRMPLLVFSFDSSRTPNIKQERRERFDRWPIMRSLIWKEVPPRFAYQFNYCHTPCCCEAFSRMELRKPMPLAGGLRLRCSL